jgi:hypothetical protein
MSKSSNYFYEYITEVLDSGRSTAIPRDVLEKEGLSMDKLNKYFQTKQGPFGLIHFVANKRSAS